MSQPIGYLRREDVKLDSKAYVKTMALTSQISFPDSGDYGKNFRPRDQEALISTPTKAPASSPNRSEPAHWMEVSFSIITMCSPRLTMPASV